LIIRHSNSDPSNPREMKSRRELKPRINKIKMPDALGVHPTPLGRLFARKGESNIEGVRHEQRGRGGEINRQLSRARSRIVDWRVTSNVINRNRARPRIRRTSFLTFAPFRCPANVRRSTPTTRQGALGEDRGWHYTTTISGSRRAAERAIVVGRYWRALNPNTVCRRALPVAPSYLRRPPTLPHKRPVVEQLHCGIPIVHVSAACMQRRIRPFMRSLAHPIPTYIPTPVARSSLRGEWPSPITIP